MAAVQTSKLKANRIIGIDYGLKRIGIAVSDENKIIAIPVMTLIAEEKTENTVTKLITTLQKKAEEGQYEVNGIVIGLPLMMSGKMGFLADEVKHFIELMRKACSIPIVTWDERLSTVQAERSLREGGMSRKKRSKVVDTITAVIILQNFLDYKKIQQTLSESNQMP